MCWITLFYGWVDGEYCVSRALASLLLVLRRPSCKIAVPFYEKEFITLGLFLKVFIVKVFPPEEPRWGRGAIPLDDN